MQVIEIITTARKWGNSIGIALPKDVVEKANIKPNKELRLFLPERSVDIGKVFGTLDINMPAKKLIEDARKGEDVLS